MIKRILFALALCSVAFNLTSSPAQATYATVATCNATAGSSAGATITTAAVNCTGADLIVVTISYYNGSPGTSSPSDSSGNTWSSAVTINSGFSSGVYTLTVYYVHAPVVSASQTFTASSSSGSEFPGISVQGFSGSAATPLDQTNSATNSVSQATIQPGSITPTQANELVISAVLQATNATETPDSGFTSFGTSYNSGANIGSFLGYLIQTSATAVNPTWTASPNAFMSAAIASFKASGAVAVTPLRTLRGVGQ